MGCFGWLEVDSVTGRKGRRTIGSIPQHRAVVRGRLSGGGFVGMHAAKLARGGRGLDAVQLRHQIHVAKIPHPDGRLVCADKPGNPAKLNPINELNSS